MKILIIKLGALGDVVMATPLIEAIQRAHPDDEIQLLTTPPFAQIFSAWDGISVHAFQRKGITAMFAMAQFVRAARFDRIYDLQGNDRTSVLCAISRSPERVGNHTRFPYTHHPPDRWRGNIHIFERMKRVLKSAKITVHRNSPVLPITQHNQSVVELWLRKHSDNKNLVGLHASASAARREKCWPHFSRLAKKLTENGFTPVWLGALNDYDNNQLLLKRSAGINASGEFEIPELAYFAEHLKFAITNDSGPMHVLAAADVPIYGLFGPSDWRRNHALGQKDHVIASPLESKSIKDISVDLVWQRLVADRRVGN